MSDSTPSSKTVTAAVIIIGNEILSGRTIDTNLPYIAKGLVEIGVTLLEARVVADLPGAIIEAVRVLSETYDYVFTTGGIGPTHDDITTECVAESFGLDVIVDPEARRRLEAHYKRRGTELNEARLRMARIPTGAALIDNPVSVAPGFQIKNVFVMAGVPNVCRAMFDGIKPRLVGGPPVLSRTVTSDMLEGNIATPLADIQSRHPEIAIGSYPFWTAQRIGVSVVLRGTDLTLLKAATDEVAAMIEELGGTPQRVEPD